MSTANFEFECVRKLRECNFSGDSARPLLEQLTAIVKEQRANGQEVSRKDKKILKHNGLALFKLCHEKESSIPQQVHAQSNTHIKQIYSENCTSDRLFFKIVLFGFLRFFLFLFCFCCY